MSNDVVLSASDNPVTESKGNSISSFCGLCVVYGWGLAGLVVLGGLFASLVGWI